MNAFSTALYVNTANRYLEVFAVSVTQTENGQLVLRNAMLMGDLKDLAGDIGLRADMPIIISLRGYQARKSAGFVSVLVGQSYVNTKTYAHAEVVGLLGFPWQHHQGLIALRTPERVMVFHPEATIRRRQTHGNLNEATSVAAYKAVELLSRIHRESGFIAIGQSNETHVFELSVDRWELEKMSGKFAPTWGTEHSAKFRLPTFVQTPEHVTDRLVDYQVTDNEVPFWYGRLRQDLFIDEED